MGTLASSFQKRTQFAKCCIKCTIQGVSRHVDITAGGEFLGLCDQKVHINMCPILDGYGVITT